ncbi:hypothetical protein AMK68_02450 [candidate division KD3-62 bacterium DG_56]|uniref:ABC transporter ATP-binding protein n=1 Tax=candidate division KD3-62 bacterium DG_56 TaxID=1704032 RepID=A0A0S7XQF5_9BACT|nr:MAG: hypothetical protein AMK68_02450 [candidate division KD3-62 bacterium DG_56]
MIGVDAAAGGRVAKLPFPPLIAFRSPYWSMILLLVLMLVAYLIVCSCHYGATYIGHDLGQRVVATLRRRIFDRLQRLSMSFHDSWRTGELMSRATQDVTLVQRFVGLQLAESVSAMATVVVGAATLLKFSWQLTLLGVIFGPVVSIVVRKAGVRMRRSVGALQGKVADLSARLQERLLSIRVVQSFAREDYEIEQFDRVNRDTVRAYMRVARVDAAQPAIVQFVSAVGLVSGLGIAGWLLLVGALAGSALLPFFYAAQRVGSQVTRLGRLHLNIQQGLAGAGRVFEILDREPDVRDEPGAVELPPVGGRIALRGVSFRYPTGEIVLRNMNVEIAPGEVVALAGPSGAGKTSLANLIPRFYDPGEGCVDIDGRDVRSVTLRSLRSQIGLVPQETMLFGGTIYDNIRYGRLEATREEVIASARAANAHDFIVELPDGYDTEVGERGVKLSGGQRQRIAIARALLKDPRILILDEATSSLDTESEALVQEALERLMKGRTTLVIAHRLSTIRNADRILVLSDGRIVEEGRHDELLALGGVYARLYEHQYRLLDVPSEGALE